MTTAPPEPQIGIGQVRHARLRPVRHAFAYPTWFLMLPMRRLRTVPSAALARNRFGLVSFHDRDHGDGRADSLAWLDELLACEGVGAAGEVWLHCIPRVLGYAFKPVSFWYCHRADGVLAAIVVEVNNTFGERHCYVLPAAGEGAVRQDCAKAFHVSPFLPMELDYAFRLAPPGERFALGITVSDRDGPMLTTVHTARRRGLSDGELARALVAYPLMTLKVVAAILWEAARLWAKRVPVFHHPDRAAQSILEPAE